MAIAAQPAQRYRELQVMTANPVQRLLMVYDVAVMGCNQRDLKRTTDALNLLRSSLDLSQGEVSLRFLRLYQYCGDLARDGKFEDAGNILRELIQAWVQVLVRQNDAHLPARPGQAFASLSVVG